MIRLISKFLALALTACLLLTGGFVGAILPNGDASADLLTGEETAAYELTEDYTVSDADCLSLADGATVNLEGHVLDLADKEIAASGDDIVISNGTIVNAEKFFASATNTIVLKNVTVVADKPLLVAGSLKLESSTIGNVAISDQVIVNYAGEDYKVGVSNISVDANSVIGQLSVSKLAEISVDGFVADLYLEEDAAYSALLLGANANVANLYVNAKHVYILGEDAFVSHAYGNAGEKPKEEGESPEAVPDPTPMSTLLSPDIYVRSLYSDEFDAELENMKEYSFVSSKPATCQERGEVVLSYKDDDKTTNVTFTIRAGHRFDEGTLVSDNDGLLDLYDYECSDCGYKYRSLDEGSFALEDCENIIDLLAFVLKDFNYDYTLTPGTKFGDITILGGYIHLLCKDGKLSGAVLANVEMSETEEVEEVEKEYITSILVKGYIDGQHFYGSFHQDKLDGEEIVDSNDGTVQSTVYDALMLLIEQYAQIDIKDQVDTAFDETKKAILAGGFLSCGIYDVEYLFDSVIESLSDAIPTHLMDTLKDASFFVAGEPDKDGNVTYTLDVDEVKSLVKRLTGKSIELLIDEELYPVEKGETAVSARIKDFILGLPEMTCGEVMDFVLDYADNAGVPAERIFGIINSVLRTVLGEEAFEAQLGGDVHALLDEQYRDIVLNEVIGIIKSESDPEGEESDTIDYYLDDYLTEETIDTIYGATLRQIITEVTGKDYVQLFLDEITNEVIAEYGGLSYVKNNKGQVISIDLQLKNLSMTAQLELTYGGDDENAVCTGRRLTITYDQDDQETDPDTEALTKDENTHIVGVFDLGYSENTGNCLKELSVSYVVTNNLADPAKEILNIGAAYYGEIYDNNGEDTYAVKGFSLDTPYGTATLITEHVKIGDETEVMWKDLTVDIAGIKVNYKSEVDEEIEAVVSSMTASAFGIEVTYQNKAEEWNAEEEKYEDADMVLCSLLVTYEQQNISAFYYETIGIAQTDEQDTYKEPVDNLHVSYAQKQDDGEHNALTVDAYWNQSLDWVVVEDILTYVKNNEFELHYVTYEDAEEDAEPEIDKDIDIKLATVATDVYEVFTNLRKASVLYSHNGTEILNAKVEEIDIDAEEIRLDVDIKADADIELPNAVPHLMLTIKNDWSRSDDEQAVLLHDFQVEADVVMPDGSDSYPDKVVYIYFDIENDQTATKGQVNNSVKTALNFGSYTDKTHQEKVGSKNHGDFSVVYTSNYNEDGDFEEELTVDIHTEQTKFSFPYSRFNTDNEIWISVQYKGTLKNGGHFERIFDKAELKVLEHDDNTNKVMQGEEIVTCPNDYRCYGFQDLKEVYNEKAGRMEWSGRAFMIVGYADVKETCYEKEYMAMNFILRDNYLYVADYNPETLEIYYQEYLEDEYDKVNGYVYYAVDPETDRNGKELVFAGEISLNASVLQWKEIRQGSINCHYGYEYYQNGTTKGMFVIGELALNCDFSSETPVLSVSYTDSNDEAFDGVLYDKCDESIVILEKNGKNVVKSIANNYKIQLNNNTLSAYLDKYYMETAFDAKGLIKTENKGIAAHIPFATLVVETKDNDSGFTATLSEYIINQYSIGTISNEGDDLFVLSLIDYSSIYRYQELSEQIANGEVLPNQMYLDVAKDGTDHVVTLGVIATIGNIVLPKEGTEGRDELVDANTCKCSVSLGYNTDPDNFSIRIYSDLGEILSRITNNFGANDGTVNTVYSEVLSVLPTISAEILTISSVKTVDEETGEETRKNLVKVDLKEHFSAKVEADVKELDDMYTLILKVDDETYFAGAARVNETTIEVFPYIVYMQDVSGYGFGLKLEKIDGIYSAKLHFVYMDSDIDFNASIGNGTLYVLADLFNQFYIGFTADVQNDTEILTSEAFFGGEDIALFDEFTGFASK